MTLSTSSLPRIVVVGMGGTIAGTAASAAQTTGYQAGALSVSQLFDAVPALGAVARIAGEQLASIDSKDMSVALWVQLSRRVDSLLASDTVDGVVITHGTDTLEETAYFLHLTLKSAKPVVLTAAMRPATALSADGPLNLLNAVTVAAAPASHGRGVLVAFANRIHSARDVTKTSTFSIDAFESPEGGPLGWVHDGKVDYERRIERRHTVATPFRLARNTSVAAGIGVDTGTAAPLHDALEPLPTVDIVLSYAGVSRVAADALVAAGAAGLVVAGTGSGSLHHDLQVALADAVERGVVVVRASRVGSGHLLRNASAADDRLGFVSAGSLSPFKARVLLMLALAAGMREPDVLQGVFDTF
ncbi:MAG: type II asparaginase [Pararobbsia sp.]